MTRRGFRSPWRRRGAIVTMVAAAALVGPVPAAAAHVAVDSAAPNGDGTTTIVLAWDHSCTPGTTTTGVEVTAGDGIELTGAATDLPGWSATTDPAGISFNGPGVPTGQPATVAVTARITAAPAATVTLPSVQHCGDQQTAWTDADPGSAHPAPSLIATGALINPVPALADDGADVTDILIGIGLFASVLAAVGCVVQRRAA